MAGVHSGTDTSSESGVSPSVSLSEQHNSSEPALGGKLEAAADGGWTYEFVDAVEKDFECNICLLPLKNPFMTRCGHSMCKTCLYKLLEKNAFCPEDRIPITKDDVFPDMRFHRKIMSLRVKCPYVEMENYGCGWTGELNDLIKRHLESCESKEVTCTRKGCGEKLSRGRFKQHIDSQCLWRETACYYCAAKIVIWKHQEHQETDCPQFTTSCPNSCDEQMPRGLIKHHLESDCPNRLISCPFLDVGCKEYVCAKDLERHLCNNVGKHLTSSYLDQMRKLTELTLAKQEQDKEIEIIKRELNETKQEVEMLKEDKKLLKFEKEQQGRRIKQLEERLNLSVTRTKQLEERLNLSVTPSFISAHPALLLSVSNLISFFAKNEDQQMWNNLIEFLKVESISDCQVMFSSWAHRKDDKMVYIWFLNDFKSCQEQQKRDSHYRVHSSHFCTGENGYFLSVGLYPYGYGNAEGTHVSCYLYTGKEGPYDNKFKFPCEQQFTVTVINLKDRQSDISAGKTFQMPKPPASIVTSSYIYEVIDHVNADKALVNDTLILKITVKYCSA